MKIFKVRKPYGKAELSHVKPVNEKGLSLDYKVGFTYINADDFLEALGENHCFLEGIINNFGVFKVLDKRECYVHYVIEKNGDYVDSNEKLDLMFYYIQVPDTEAEVLELTATNRIINIDTL